jgi:hypothetical protein
MRRNAQGVKGGAAWPHGSAAERGLAAKAVTLAFAATIAVSFPRLA